MMRHATWNDGTRAGYNPAQVVAESCRDITLRNCVLADNWFGVFIFGGHVGGENPPTTFTAQNNVFTYVITSVHGAACGKVNFDRNTSYVPRIINFVFGERAQCAVSITNNLFFGQAGDKVGGAMVWDNRPASSNYNAFFYDEFAQPGCENQCHEKFFIDYGMGERGLAAIQHTPPDPDYDANSQEPVTTDVWLTGGTNKPVTQYMTESFGDTTEYGNYWYYLEHGDVIPTIDMFVPHTYSGGNWSASPLDIAGRVGGLPGGATVPIGARACCSDTHGATTAPSGTCPPCSCPAP
jgi:hypothetical protein